MINGKEVLCVITARAGSKGLPGKNYRALNKHPLVVWSILAAQKSEIIDYTLISTNCIEVKKASMVYTMSRRLKTMVCDRPEHLCTENSSNEEALFHAIDYCKENVKLNPQIIVNLQPTSPIRNNNLIDKVLSFKEEHNKDSILTVSKTTPFLWKARNGFHDPIPTYDVKHRPMRQHLQVHDYYYHDNGNVYAVDIDALNQRKCRIGYNPALYLTDEFQSHQIDTEKDFLTIEHFVSNGLQLV